MDQEKYLYNNEVWDYEDLLGYFNLRDYIACTVLFIAKYLGDVK